ncbi:alpha/beta family hydrolase [Conexibacter sp. SYSU D00693]|uniref:alpha/beta hydrolase family protein n=1 Tax=Conexibacter sp. SYSU D00693 TaxID=2812560 RepID=UPI00196AB90F|nr:alpha/beta family hydrolase [Conexibacter sp. SYSU D00693]
MPAAAPTVVEPETPHGPARVHLHAPEASPRAALLLGHGAGGGVAAPDLLAATETALQRGVLVGLVEQPYRVAGRRSVAPTHQLDAAWEAVVAHLRTGPLADLPVLLQGGRSSGARVACRTATATGAAGVLALAFPLEPPTRKPGAERRSRLPELEAVAVPVLVVQGERDRFGIPPAAPPAREVVVLKGDHALKADRARLQDALGGWLQRLLP